MINDVHEINPSKEDDSIVNKPDIIKIPDENDSVESREIVVTKSVTQSVMKIKSKSRMIKKNTIMTKLKAKKCSNSKK